MHILPRDIYFKTGLCVLTYRVPGWKEKHDIWLNLKVDIKRFCFIEMLDADQIKDGVSLSESQLADMVAYVHTGALVSKVNAPHPSHHALENSSKKVDIQDIYKSKANMKIEQNKITKHWRPGEIIAIHDCHVHVHYIGWGDEWDEVVDTSVEGQRIKIGGSKIIPRGTSRDTYTRQIIAASPTAKNYRKHDFKKKESAKVTTRRRSLGEQSSTNLDSLVCEELSKKKQKQSKSKRADIPPSVAVGGGSVSGECVKNKLPRRGMSRTRSFPPLSYDEDNQQEEAMFKMYEQQEHDYYAALQQEKSFISALNEQKMHVVEVDGDGNCLFRAVAHQIWLDEDRHMELRKRCVAHMREHAERYASFFDGDFTNYLYGMNKSGTWGDDIEIRALEEITDRIIFIYSSQSLLVEPLKTNFDEVALLGTVSPLKISYHGKNHYNSIFDETVCLPLPMRSSNVLLTTRHKQLMG